MSPAGALRCLSTGGGGAWLPQESRKPSRDMALPLTFCSRPATTQDSEGKADRAHWEVRAECTWFVRKPANWS